MEISLFTPVRQDADTLALVLESHRALHGVTERIYMDDNVEWASSELLGREAEEYPGKVRIIRPPIAEAAAYKDHKWTGEALNRITRLRNHGVEVFLAGSSGAMFTVDSDVVLHPQTVAHLAGCDKPVVFEVFWSKWPGSDAWLPQVWDYHPWGFKSADRILRLKQRGLYDVHGGGACTLIRREVFNAGARYDPIKALTKTVWGEDRWFCIRAECAWFDLWADTEYPPFHVYEKGMYEEARRWWAEGAHPGYFRKYWLTEKWEEAIRKGHA